MLVVNYKEIKIPSVMFRSGLEISLLMNAVCCIYTWMSLCNVFVCDVMLVVYYLYYGDVSNGS